MSDNSRLVYSTEHGKIKPQKPAATPPRGDGIVRLRRETKGRKGKGVTLVDGVPLAEPELKALGKQLKQRCGSGGSVKNGIIEVQGDHRAAIKEYLEAQGYKVKLAGG